MNYEENIQNEQLTPSEYFNIIKSKKQNITNEDLLNIYSNCEQLANKYVTTGQTSGLRKIIFYMETVAKEIEIVALGINTYIHRQDVEEYIDSISKDVVKIIELENYEREVPDDIIEMIENVKNKFTKLYVLFTDYTGKEEKKVAKARRDKDPILFGTFHDDKLSVMVDRFYFLADWEDEYCDLTFDKMIGEIKSKNSVDPTKISALPSTIEELKAKLSNISTAKNAIGFAINENNVTLSTINTSGDKNTVRPKKSFFANIKTFFSRVVNES